MINQNDQFEILLKELKKWASQNPFESIIGWGLIWLAPLVGDLVYMHTH